MDTIFSLLRRFNPYRIDNWRIFNFRIFEDDTDFYHFLRPFTWTIYIGVTVLVQWIVEGGVFGGAKIIIGLIAVAFFVGMTVMVLSRAIASAAGGLYHSGSHKPDRKALLKDLYSLANGYKQTDDYDKALDTYRTIIKQYPEELDAKFQMAKLYEQSLGKPEKALNQYKRLKRKIRLEKVDYKYSDALESRILDLEKYIEEELNTASD